MYSKRNFNFNFIYLISSHPSYFSQIILFLLPFPLFLFRLDYLSVSYLLLIFSIIIKVHFYLIFIFCLHISYRPSCLLFSDYSLSSSISCRSLLSRLSSNSLPSSSLSLSRVTSVSYLSSILASFLLFSDHSLIFLYLYFSSV
uniref:Uncharacterized protein n=1 Tax=Cacopsylla melanoneura TaxID=428564 RepID=A0A8D8ZNR2_9HEMI